jgi:predicted nucleotidyltransferase component of viral defense system
MLSLEQITEQYPVPLRPFQRSLLVEYLQCKILGIIYASKFAPKLSFLGGTSLRIIYDNTRFSEDLDFDNFGLTINEFKNLAETIQKGLEAEGLVVEVKLSTTNALRCNIRLVGALYENKLSGHPEEKILIHIDSVPHLFKYAPDKKILNKFDVFSEVFVTPVDIILSQKLYAAVNRKRAKGRDFFDIVFLTSITTPNYNYLKAKLGVGNAAELKAKLQSKLKNLDFKELGRDVQPFLFNPADAKRVELFPEFLAQANL